ncbi:hypothetical protein OOK13_06660 [Streptomyces sp. NBC_00378]|uniref:hypothetical protein n=1 Tax=unclassified Streptomyces TaxID=2593676 RepID=UPI00224E435C|nr:MULTISPECIES: hypothetical protein [unclassified Streptomyces]MCX5108207.1 hypothetical protein [Streptomyces sp. NBC_00378]
MTGTAGPASRTRLGRLTGAVVLLAPLLVAGSASAPQGAPRLAAAADESPVDAGRIAYAGTEHRSLGRVSDQATTAPLFGPGPAHYDQDPSARGEVVVFTSLRDSVRPQVYVRDAGGAVRRLTTDRDAAHPELSPDGQTVVFDSAERGPGDVVQRELWTVGVDGSGLRRLTDTPNNETSPTFSPDGSRIAYSCDSGPGGNGLIYERAVAGGAARVISDGPAGDATEPEWNPVDDDTHRARIAYTLTTDEETGPRLRVTEGIGADRPLLAGVQADWRTRSAAWLPDGNDLLFLSPDTTCGCKDYDHVYRATAFNGNEPGLTLGEDRAVESPTWVGPMDPGSVVVARRTQLLANDVTLQDVRQDGADPRDLGVEILKEDPEASTNTDPAKDPLFNPAADYDPWTERQNYTPDGRRIVVTRFEGEPKQRVERIWLTDADGQNKTALPLAGRGPRDWDTDPTFSPDGTKLAFTRTSPGGVGEAAGPSSILIADVATGAIVGRIVPPEGQLAGGDAQPTWSSDGKTLAFTRNHVIRGLGGIKHVWTVPVAALDQQRDLSVTVCPGECKKIDDSPAFSPDGTRIAFNRKDGGGRVNERSGILVTSLSGDDCRVVLPSVQRDNPDACHQEIPDTSLTGPFQPRDVAWSPDAERLVLSSRREVGPSSPEQLSMLDLASGTLTPFGERLGGRQKEPAFQQSVDLALTAPPTGPSVEVGSSVTVPVTVTNRGPAASPGTVLTVDAPPGVRLEELTTPAGTCATGSPRCDLGVLRPGESIEVTARLTGVTSGDQQIGWSVTGAVVDPNPTDNATATTVPVQDVPPAPTPSPKPPKPPRPAPQPPEPEAGPGVTVRAQPSPGYVGGRVVVTYTVRNGRNALATGLRLKLGLPASIPADPLPPGCTAGVCTLPDLTPGASTVVRVVLKPDRALRTTITGTLTTTGTDADTRDNVSRKPLRILQPRIVSVPAVGKPGFVTSVRGKDFPPGAPVKLTWKPGITAAAPPAFPRRDGTFIAQLLILAKDQTGPRKITASGPGFGPVTTRFLVVAGTIVPPDEVGRR